MQIQMQYDTETIVYFTIFILLLNMTYDMGKSIMAQCLDYKSPNDIDIEYFDKDIDKLFDINKYLAHTCKKMKKNIKKLKRRVELNEKMNNYEDSCKCEYDNNEYEDDYENESETDEEIECEVINTICKDQKDEDEYLNEKTYNEYIEKKYL